MRKIYLPAAVLLVLTQGCSTNQPQVDKLRVENHELKVRLAALHQDTTSEAAALASPSPASTLSDTSTSTSPTLSLSSVASSSAAGAAATSMWKVRHYVNDFGDATKKGYIANEMPIVGTFSNSATQDSPLLVRLMFDKDLSINIHLYEYAGNNPVKAYGSDAYSVKVKDKDGKAYRLHGTNYASDRLTLDKSSAKQLHVALLKGGKVQFVINEDDTPTTNYAFALDNADGYLDARKKIKGGK